MKVWVIEEIQSAKGIIPVGSLIEIPADVAEKLKGKVMLPPSNGGRGLPHYCKPGDCWCSAKLPDASYPAECIKINCAYHGM